MAVLPSGLRRCAALLASVLAVCLGMACHKSKSAVPAGAFQITGTVTYTRVPLHVTGAGVPTGLETDSALFTSNPARGVGVRVFQLRPQTQQDFTTVYVWAFVASAYTDQNGNYSVANGVLQGYPTFVELTSVTQEVVAPSSVVAIIADPDGVYSTRQIPDRPVYVLRKDVAGNPVTSPTSVTTGINDTTVNFTVGLTDGWQTVNQKWWIPAQNLLPTFDAQPVPVGSKPLAILDSLYYFQSEIGNAVPSPSATELDIHYRPGVSTQRGSFFEFNPKVFPKAYDGQTYHYFGAIRGGGTLNGLPQSDDAYDTGTLYPLFGRGYLFGQRKVNLIPTGVPTPSLAPDLALVEGLGDAMGALLNLSPYLPGNTYGNRYAAPRDIRDLSALSQAQIGPFSAPTLSALTWELALVNTGIVDPGGPESWANINPQALRRFYTLLSPTMQNGTTVVTTDCPSIYTQLARLQEAQGAGDPSNLELYFQDNVLTPLCARFNIPWTNYTNAILPQYTTDWGVDPDTNQVPFPVIPLSMGLAQQINLYSLDAANHEQVTQYYPNNSRGEVNYAILALTLDRTYNLSVATVPALPAGVSIEVVIDGDLPNAYVFSAGSAPVPITLQGNPTDVTTPLYHSVRVRILSPQVLAPDMQVTLLLQRTS